MASVTSRRIEQGKVPAQVAAGVTGGLAGGVVFGALMQMMGMMPMIAMLIGSKSIAIGWIVHLAISAFIGAAFGVLAGGRVLGPGRSALAGLAYGAFWWVLGPMLIMPARLGMQLFVINSMTGQSLGGHLMYGLILGLVFDLVRRRLALT